MGENQTSNVGRFWVYSQACDKLWDNAPSQMDSYGLTGILTTRIARDFYGL